jgi:transcriptional regulator GlxA family with amidase domain
VRVALVVYPGVLADECEAFRSVLSLLDDAVVVAVGESPGVYEGPGGRQQVEETFDEVSSAELVVVPGGLGAERSSTSEPLLAWLRTMEPVARYVVSSSTGSVLLAAAGLLHGEPAATHWLATDLLRRYGSERASGRLTVAGNVVTAEGTVSAVDAAFTIVERLAGPAAVERIRATLIERGAPHLAAPRWWERFVPQRMRPDPVTVAEQTPTDPVTPLSVMIELVPVEELRKGRRPRRKR